jgi:hypothetical protein
MILASMASTISFNSRLKPNRNGDDLRIQEMKKLGYATDLTPIFGPPGELVQAGPR